MSGFDRRAFLGMSVGAVSMLRHPGSVLAQTPACAPGGMAPFLPVRLNVDCASRKNFQLFRKNTNDIGLAGVVSMTFVRGRYGSYDAGSMIVFPWLKPKGQNRQALAATLPVDRTQFMASTPIPDATLPVDEYFCKYRLQAPSAMFIGFHVDVPYSRVEGRFDWFTNVKLADGKSVGIDWTSSNLNDPWFGGSRFIPNKDACSGPAWRKLIVDGLMQASSALC
ncbi:hypothetical protein [uncultured Bradyrhizobium sp.]|uniref:hypothetical protein n=1 Tax=uncultured Bradyrhizobium sp. TaxID=199684 RepID=UPI0035CC4D00